MLLCVAYVRFCDTGQTPPVRSKSGLGRECGDIFSEPEAPPTFTSDGAAMSDRSDSAMHWLMYGHCLARESRAPPPPPFWLITENERMKPLSFADDMPRK